MYIQVKTADFSQSKRVEVSKLTSVKELKLLVEEALNVKPDRQRLFFRGKQLEDDYKVFDYNINLNDVVMLMIKPILGKPDLSAFKFGVSSQQEQDAKQKDTKAEINGTHNSHEKNDHSVSKGSEQEDTNVDINGTGGALGKCDQSLSHEDIIKSYFKVGDVVDALFTLYGAWFEGKIAQIQAAGNAFLSSNDPVLNTLNSDRLMYKVSFDCCPDDPPFELPLECLRPYSHALIKLCDIKVGDLVLVNYNIESPDRRGFWYDMTVTSLPENNSSDLIGTIYVGREKKELKNCKILFTDEIFKIVKPGTVQDTSIQGSTLSTSKDSDDASGGKARNCPICQDYPKCRCKSCGCCVCGGKDEPNRQIMCDECNKAFHLRCLKPPLAEIPDADEWYCAQCKNDENEIVKAGGKLKESKKKKKMPSAKDNESQRDWGKGMACAGRTKQCTLVPPNHFGPIPGVDVGTSWKFRITASEAGVHRPPVAGIHGRDTEGAYSLVLSGGYEDDVDNGEEFIYTGSGGRDLSGNKRVAEQSKDQTLTRMNLALALNCNAPVNKESGSEAQEWREGKPVRVLRNFKLGKYSEYAPEEGNRYDGIYKVVKYYPEKGEAGFIVWRYLLRRDDPAPAPWTDEGRKNIESLGLTMIYPDGYDEMAASKETSENSSGGAQSKKRFLDESASDNTDDRPHKKPKMSAYTLDEETSSKIALDDANEKLWTFCKNTLVEGKMKFLSEVQEQFMCVCCQELVCDPVTTPCHHNICKACLKRSFSAEVFSCPSCRQELGKQFVLATNHHLSSALCHLFPGYEIGR